MFYVKIAVFFKILAVVISKEVCYEYYGCFTTDKPFGGTDVRPFAILPENPLAINITFKLYTPKPKSDSAFISPNSFNDNFDKLLPTKIIIHGFLDTPDISNWMQEMMNSILSAEDSNVIITNWGGGSFKFYTIAAANTQIVGVEVARLISMLVEKAGVRVDSFHCIGHSLGAHACGYAGKRIKQIGRITGMDPAGPYFENTPSVVRLDKTDAKFVDIIHTDTNKLVANNSFGINSPIGHVDFYPNGGKFQPGCEITDGNIQPHCSHSAATFFFQNSISNKCALIAYPCESYEKFLTGDCLKCGPNGCNRMGYYATAKNDQNSLYLETNSFKLNYVCKHYHQVVLTSSNFGEKKAKGLFTIYFSTSAIISTDSELSSTETLDNSNIVFDSNSVHKRLVSIQARLKLPEISSAFITYKRVWNPLEFWKYEEKWMFKNIEIFSVDHQSKVTLCPIENMFDKGITIKYVKCLN